MTTVEKGFVDVAVPADCWGYPGVGMDRIVRFQKTCAWVGDHTCYVATEAKVAKYHHVMFFARFHVEEAGVRLAALQRSTIDYEYDAVCEVEVDLGTQGAASDGEVASLIPFAPKPGGVPVSFAAGNAVCPPRDAFDVRLKGAGKATLRISLSPYANDRTLQKSDARDGSQM